MQNRNCVYIPERPVNSLKVALSVRPKIKWESPDDTGHDIKNIPIYNKTIITELLLLLLLLVFSPWAGHGRDQSSVRRLVWLWYAASWANS
jgi:hypothetical protein